jgi:hypothetical protein
VFNIPSFSARSPTTVSPVLPGAAAVGPSRASVVATHGSASELAPHAANVMTAWTDKLYTENMGIIFTNAVTPAAVVASSAAGASGGAAAATTTATAAAAAAAASSSSGGGTLMNNGRQDTSLADIQKLQQQLQDIKDQVFDYNVIN